MFRQLRQSEFARSVVVLMTGTVVAQLITYLIYLLLTRIYSTADMGELGMYMRIVAFVSGIATARYELSLPLAKQELHAFYLYRLSFRIALVILFATTVAGLIYFLLQPLQLGNFSFLVMTAMSAFFMVWINLGTNWSIRIKAFKRISQQRVINAIATNILRLLFGLFSWGAPGLILATLIGTLLSGFVFIREFFRIKRFYQAYKPSKRMRILSKEYRQFPLINLPHVLLDLGVDLVVALFIVQRFGESEFGSYSHAYAMLRLPLGLVGQSIGQVFFNKASEMVNKEQPVLNLLLKTCKTLFLIAIVPFTLLFFFGEELFAVVFSEKWRESGKLSEIMAPWLMINFVVSSVSNLPLVFGRQKEIFLVGIVSAIGQLTIYGVLPFVFPGLFFRLDQLVWCTVGFQSLLLIFLVFTYIRFAKNQLLGSV